MNEARAVASFSRASDREPSPDSVLLFPDSWRRSTASPAKERRTPLPADGISKAYHQLCRCRAPKDHGCESGSPLRRHWPRHWPSNIVWASLQRRHLWGSANGGSGRNRIDRRTVRLCPVALLSIFFARVRRSPTVAQEASSQTLCRGRVPAFRHLVGRNHLNSSGGGFPGWFKLLIELRT